MSRKFSRAVVTVAAFALSTAVLVQPQVAVASVPDSPAATAQVGAGSVYAIAQVGDRTIIAGSFTRVGGKPRANVAAILPDGTVDPSFNPGTDGPVYAVAATADGSRIFLGGMFTMAGGAARANLAAVDAAGIAVPDWQADTVGTTPDVKSLAVFDNRVYVAGRYGGIDGTTRKRLTAVTVDTGAVIPQFKPLASGSVREVVVSPDGTKVYAGGTFVTIGGASRPNSAAELDAATGLATTFNPSAGGGFVVTVELTPDGSRFFFATENNTVFAYDLVSDAPVWARKMSGNTQAMAATVNGELFVGGHFSQNLETKAKRPFFASFDVADGDLTPWAPQVTGGKMGVWAFAIDGDTLHAGGVFKYFGAVKQQGYARFNGDLTT